MCVLGWAGHLLHKWMAHICRRLQVGLHVSYIRGAISKVHVGCIRKPSDMQVPKVHLAHLGQLDHVHTCRLLLAAESCKADIWFPELVCSLVEVWLCILKTDIARAVLHMYICTYRRHLDPWGHERPCGRSLQCLPAVVAPSARRSTQRLKQGHCVRRAARAQATGEHVGNVP